MGFVFRVILLHHYDDAALDDLLCFLCIWSAKGIIDITGILSHLLGLEVYIENTPHLNMLMEKIAPPKFKQEISSLRTGGLVFP